MASQLNNINDKIKYVLDNKEDLYQNEKLCYRQFK